MQICCWLSFSKFILKLVGNENAHFSLLEWCLVALNAHQTLTAPEQVLTWERGNCRYMWLSCLLALSASVSLSLPLSHTHTLFTLLLTLSHVPGVALSLSVNQPEWLSLSISWPHTSCLFQSFFQFYAILKHTMLASTDIYSQPLWVSYIVCSQYIDAKYYFTFAFMRFNFLF